MEKMTDKKAERERSQATEPNTERGSGAAVCFVFMLLFLNARIL